jgi:hypothetical protein
VMAASQNVDQRRRRRAGIGPAFDIHEGAFYIPPVPPHLRISLFPIFVAANPQNLQDLSCRRPNRPYNVFFAQPNASILLVNEPFCLSKFIGCTILCIS